MSDTPARAREKAQVLDEAALDRALTRIAHEILEGNGGAKDLAFVGLRTRGVSLAHRLDAKTAHTNGPTLPAGRGPRAPPGREDRPHRRYDPSGRDARHHALPRRSRHARDAGDPRDRHP